MSGDRMTFPNTWDEFEKIYGFTDKEEIYTNGSRLIPSFRVEQWLEHLDAIPARHAKLLNAHPYGECSNCGYLIDIREEFNYCPNCGAKMDK